MLESNLQNSDIMIATALVTPNEFVPVCLLNPIGTIVLYSRANVAVMSEISEIKDDNLVSVSLVSQQLNSHDLEEVFQELLKGIPLPNHQQDLLRHYYWNTLMFLQFPKISWDTLSCCNMRLLLFLLFARSHRMSLQME